ncbi:hypothetical protein M0R45_038414 [Rubus argutus]|uniref:60S ribosomal protein L13 n=1 Tax=Rubus argutus TaxID=59490 RepID=A0AAW1W5J0_RUBAR
MVKHNNMIPGEHFRKHWQSNVKTGFNQPGRKTRRRIARHIEVQNESKGWQGLQPFTLEELKAAGISKKVAPSIGIAVDHRRKNRSFQGLQANVQLLQTYKQQLVV